MYASSFFLIGSCSCIFSLDCVDGYRSNVSWEGMLDTYDLGFCCSIYNLSFCFCISACYVNI